MVKWVIKNILASFIGCILLPGVVLAGGSQSKGLGYFSIHDSSLKIPTEDLFKELLEKFKKSLPYNISKIQEKDFLEYLRTILPSKKRCHKSFFYERVNDLSRYMEETWDVKEEDFSDFFMNETVENIKENLSYVINERQESEFRKLIQIFKKRKIDLNDSMYDYLLEVEPSHFEEFCIQAALFFQNLIFDCKNENIHSVTCIDMLEQSHLNDITSLEYSEIIDLASGIITVLPVKNIKEDLGGAGNLYFKYALDVTQHNELKKLFDVFEKREIAVTQSFLDLFSELESSDLSNFCIRATCFFQHLNEELKYTGSLTSMLGKEQEYIKDFASRNMKEIAFLASHDTHASFALMYQGKGLPRMAEMKKILSWSDWYLTRDKEFNLKLLESFAIYHAGKGCPTMNDLKDYFVQSKNSGFQSEVGNTKECIIYLLHVPGMQKQEELLQEDTTSSKKSVCGIASRCNRYVKGCFYESFRDCKLITNFLVNPIIDYVVEGITELVNSAILEFEHH